jgi:hypothetical protein
MTLESANICSKMLSFGVGEAARLSPPGDATEFCIGREVAELVAEANGLPSTAAPIATNIAMCSFLYRNAFCWELAFGLGSSDLDSEVWEKTKWTLRKPRNVHTRSVRAWQRRASTAAPSVKQRKRRRRSLARAHTPDAKASRTSHHFIIG